MSKISKEKQYAEALEAITHNACTSIFSKCKQKYPVECGVFIYCLPCYAKKALASEALEKLTHGTQSA